MYHMAASNEIAFIFKSRTKQQRCVVKILLILMVFLVLTLLYTPAGIYARKGFLTVYFYVKSVDCSYCTNDVTSAECNGTIIPPKVPRYVHYVWFRDPNHTLRFNEYISLLSSYKFIKPDKIFVWCNNEPGGYWWIQAREKIKTLEVRIRSPPTEIAGKPVSVPEHKSDVARLDIMLNIGGIYLDFDVVALKSFDPLLEYDTTMGYEMGIPWPKSACGGIIISKPHAGFLQVWWRYMKQYFNDKDWAFHSVLLPGALSVRCNQLIHIEEKTLHRPNYLELKWIYEPCCIYDWSKNYAMHLWYRFYDKDHNPNDIKTLNSTLGQVFRYVYYGSPDNIYQ